jgi:tetratricopeptide (TPR) repeat protein
VNGKEVYLDGERLRFPYEKARELFFALFEAGRRGIGRVDRETLCRSIWGENLETSRQNLRNALSVLRRILPPGSVSADRKSVALDAGAIEILTPDTPSAPPAERTHPERMAPGPPSFPGLEALSREERELLDCVSVFPGGAPFGLLTALSGLDETALVRLCDGLFRMGILAADETRSIAFRGGSLKALIGGNLSGLKRWSLCRRLLSAAKDAGLTTDFSANPKLKGFSLENLAELARCAGEPETELDIRLQALRRHFEFRYELFPMLSDAELQEASREDDKNLPVRIAEAEELLDRLTRTLGRTPRLRNRERELLTLQGGYLRWNGDYTGAANCLDEALRLAAASEERARALPEVLEQFCCLGIQQDSPGLLRRYALPFYRESRKAELHPQTGMALRFLAILGILEGRRGAAEKLLGMSIRLFEKLESRGDGYTLGVIAATHYHGDIALFRGRHGDAGKRYDQCAKLCEGRGFHRIRGLFLAKGAWCALRLGRPDEARTLVAEALPLFGDFRSHRGAGMCAGEIVFGLAAFFGLQDNPDGAPGNLRRAEVLSGIIQKPLYNAIHLTIKAALKDGGPSPLDEILTRDAAEYRLQAENLFKSLGIPGETSAFGQLRALMKPRCGPPPL